MLFKQNENILEQANFRVFRKNENVNDDELIRSNPNSERFYQTGKILSLREIIKSEQNILDDLIFKMENHE